MQSCSKITYFFNFEAKNHSIYLGKIFGTAVLCNLNFPAILFIISLKEGESGSGRLLSWQGCVWLSRAGLHLLLRLVNIYFLVIFIRHFSRFFR